MTFGTSAVLIGLGVIPAIVAYVHARWFYFRLGQLGSRLKQLGALAVIYAFMYGPFFLQAAVVDENAPSDGRQLMRYLVPLQYGVAIIVFFWRLLRSQKEQRARQRRDV